MNEAFVVSAGSSGKFHQCLRPVSSGQRACRVQRRRRGYWVMSTPCVVSGNRTPIGITRVTSPSTVLGARSLRSFGYLSPFLYRVRLSSPLLYPVYGIVGRFLGVSTYILSRYSSIWGVPLRALGWVTSMIPDVEVPYVVGGVLGGFGHFYQSFAIRGAAWLIWEIELAWGTALCAARNR